MKKYQLIYDLLKKLYGSRFVQNLFGTRTNVEKLPTKNDPRKVMFDADKLAQDTSSLMLAKEKVKDVAAFVPKMNDSELKMFENNLKAVAMGEGKLEGIEKIDSTADIIDIKSGKKMDESGIRSLMKKETSPEMNLDEIMNIDEIIDMMTKNPARRGGPLDPATGITRTAARSILNKKGITEIKGDPLDMFRENFGQDALGDLANVSEELIEIERRGGSYKDLDQILEREGFFDLKIDKDAPKGMSDEELKELIKKEDERVSKDEDAIKEIFDPEDPPTKKASGGLAGILGV
tara:strand:+ start:415 stop:1290 length:876 start_codon:yes stop_codon:yes gene_type:complete